MSMSKISVEDLVKKTESIYEAVSVMSRRARQVNNEQRMEIESEMEILPASDNRESEDFDDVEIDREALLRDYKKYPKPTRVTIDEMIDGKIEFRYKDEEGEEAEEPPKEEDNKKKSKKKRE